MQKLALPIFAALLTVSLLSAADERPNFIIIMVDDMGFAGPSISPYSNPNYETPGMDKLAREGMRFTPLAYKNPQLSLQSRVGPGLSRDNF